jgi:tetratricopeptide (TPR) repeat protein
MHAVQPSPFPTPPSAPPISILPAPEEPGAPPPHPVLIAPSAPPQVAVQLSPFLKAFLDCCSCLDHDLIPQLLMQAWIEAQGNEGDNAHQYLLQLQAIGCICLNDATQMFQFRLRLNPTPDIFTQALQLWASYIEPFNPQIPETWHLAEQSLLHLAKFQTSLFWIAKRDLSLKVCILSCVGAYHLHIRLDPEIALTFFSDALDMLEGIEAGALGGEENGPGLGGVPLETNITLLLQKGLCLLKQNMLAGAEETFGQVSGLIQQSQHLHLQTAQYHLYCAQLKLAQRKSAPEIFSETHQATEALKRAQPGPLTDLLRAETCLKNGDIFHSLHSFDQALRCFDEALGILGNTNPLMKATLLHCKGHALQRLERKEDSLAAHLEARVLRLTHLPQPQTYRTLCQSYESVALALLSLHRKDEARAELIAYLEKLSLVLGHDHPRVQQATQFYTPFIAPNPPLDPLNPSLFQRLVGFLSPRNRKAPQ